MRACHAGLLDIVHLLYECSFNCMLGYPVDVDKVDFLGATALMKAAQVSACLLSQSMRAQQQQHIEELVRQPWSSRPGREQGALTSLRLRHCAAPCVCRPCQSGHLIICKYLLEMLNARVNIKDYDGWSALMFAASKGHWHIVEYLVQAWSVRTPPLAEAWERGFLLRMQMVAGDTWGPQSLYLPSSGGAHKDCFVAPFSLFLFLFLFFSGTPTCLTAHCSSTRR
jgi:hypothetical protein